MFTKEKEKYKDKEKDKFSNKDKTNTLKAREDLFDILDKTPIATLLTFNAEELFEIQEQASLELDKANYRKKWIDGVIELKYKSTIESSYKKALEYFNNEPFVEMDRYNSSLLTDYINDGDSIIKVEFYRTGRIKDKERDVDGDKDINRGRYIEYSQIRKRFSLIKVCQINNDNKNIKNNNNNNHNINNNNNDINNSSNNRTDGGCYGNK